MTRRFRSHVSLFMAVALALGLVVAAPGNAAAQSPSPPLKLRLASLAIGSSWYLIGAAVMESLRPQLPAGSTIDLLPYAGGVGNPPLLSRGEAELALGTSVTNRWAWDGTVAYKEPMRNLRGLVGGFDRHYLGIVVPRRLGIKSLTELKEKKAAVRVKTLKAGSLGELGLRQALAAAGVTYDDIKRWGGSVEQTDFGAIIAALRDGRADLFGQVISVGHPAFTEITLTTDVLFIALEPEVVEKLGALGWYADALPAGSFKGQDRAVASVGFTDNLMVTEAFPADLAYRVTKAVVENKARLVQGYASTKVFVPEDAWKPQKNGIPLHPGAERYYRERGWLK